MKDSYQNLRVERIVDESWNTKSFYLRPADGSAIEAYAPGQHLLFSLPVDPAEPDLKMMRFYTLSDCYRSGGAYRITVKHEVGREAAAPDGAGSTYLHQHMTVGDRLQAKKPMGDFTLEAADEDGGVVLIGGGIGITPILAMAQSIAAEGNSYREVRVFLGMRNREDHPFKDEFAALVRDFPSIQLNVCYDESTAADVQGSDYDYAERVSVDLFKRVLSHNRYRYYICGPRPMMDALTGDLAAWGVAEAQIFTESFGPATASHLIEQSEADGAAAAAEDAASDVIEVNFARNGVTHTWDPRYKCLLEFAEAKGVSISAGCLYGDCGTCMTPLKQGAVGYNHPTEITPDEGCCLPCSCKPTSSITLEA